MKAIQVYGLQRSGTNYVRYMIEHHFVGVHVNAKGKHEPNLPSYADKGPEDWANFLGYIVISKDPYAWIVSFADWHYRRFKPKKPFEVHLKNVIIAKGKFDMLRRWNQSYYAWMQLLKNEEAAVLWRYESVLASPVQTIVWTKRHFGLRWKKMQSVEPPKQHLRWFRDREDQAPVESLCYGKKGPMPDFTKESYYLNREYMKYFDSFLRMEMSRRIDWKVANYYDYEMEYP